MSREMDRAGAPLAGVAILVVEDDSDARRLASIALEAWGGIVLTDLGLPRLDGRWLLRQIRKLPADKGGRVPVVAFSAYFQPRERELIRAAGFQDLISKPIDPFELCSVIAKTLS